MIGKIKYFLIVGFVLILGGCSLNDDGPNFHFTALEIVSAELPDAFELNETYRIDVTFNLPNGCTSFNGFDVTQEDTTVRNVVVFGAVRTDIDDCSEELVQEESFFNFVVVHNEPYLFKFYQGENSEGEPEFFEVTVPVN
ncbi:hypothetical protein [Maribacter sp. 2210JD10-5]|uniref:hypothetical protein n=1 Tax=Maribacter sp. 2210JD10-5 TaxID=3386272 RepID=UPI0039BD3D03